MIGRMGGLLIATVAIHAAQAATVSRIDAAPAREGWFVCDAVAGPYAALVGKPDAGGTSRITILDHRTGRLDTQAYRVGPDDHGAGQVYWPLSRQGREVGHVHGINPGMVASDGIAPIMGLTIGGRAIGCRWLANMRFIGLDARRSIAVTREAGGFVYRSFDYRKLGPVIEPDGAQVSNAATLTIAGGRAVEDGFGFSNRGYDYRIAWDGTHPATVTVSRAGRTLQVETLVGYATSGR